MRFRFCFVDGRVSALVVRVHTLKRVSGDTVVYLPLLFNPFLLQLCLVYTGGCVCTPVVRELFGEDGDKSCRLP